MSPKVIDKLTLLGATTLLKELLIELRDTRAVIASIKFNNKQRQVFVGHPRGRKLSPKHRAAISRGRKRATQQKRQEHTL